MGHSHFNPQKQHNCHGREQEALAQSFFYFCLSLMLPIQFYFVTKPPMTYFAVEFIVILLPGCTTLNFMDTETVLIPGPLLFLLLNLQSTV